MIAIGLPEIATWSVAWLLFGLVSGWAANRLSVDSCSHDGPITRIRRWERGGSIYRSIGVHRWKGLLPEAGDFFSGGMSKRHLPDGRSETLVRFAAETRRAERVHWSNVAFGPTFFLWNSWAIGVTMTVFGLSAHLPFVVIQRYNRGRLARLCSRRQRVRHPLPR